MYVRNGPSSCTNEVVTYNCGRADAGDPVSELVGPVSEACPQFVDIQSWSPAARCWIESPHTEPGAGFRRSLDCVDWILRGETAGLEV